MGESANVFYSSDESKATLDVRVTLLPQQIEYARSKKDHLLNDLKKQLSVRSGVTVAYWLQGSYKNHTLIRPVRKKEEFDIDAGVYLLFNAEKSGVQAADAKSALRDVLAGYCSRNNDAQLADSKPNCERICYRGNFHIDLPLYFFDQDGDVCRLATESSGWIDSDPKSLQDWFEKTISGFSDQKKARLRRVIKYIKTWVSLKTVKLPSIAVTVFVAKYFHDYAQDDDAFIQSATSLANHLLSGGQISSPINGDDLIGGDDEDETKLRNELSNLRNFLTRAKDCNSASEAHPYWSAIFEHIYPPFAEIEEVHTVANLPALTSPPSVNIRIKDKKKGFIESSSAETIHGYIGETLDFSVTNPDSYPAHAIVKWMVRNKGQEASLANDLGHLDILGVRDVCDEHCGYIGTHYMECVVEANGIVLGAKSIKVKIARVSRPLRTSPRRSYLVRK
ncbi:MAG: CBASS cGAMP synthase [Cycloclasticus sp.]|nr:CBASS cGAMP synthase [Cycloclasticus sp.]